MGDVEKHTYAGPERRSAPRITAEQIEQIAERAAEIAVQRMADNAFRAIGKGVVERVLWVFGVGAVALYVFLSNKGLLK